MKEKGKDENKENKIKKPHNFSLDNRKKGNATGVSKVISSSSSLLSLETSEGGLSVQGSELKITKYNADEGYLSFEGTVNSLKYTASKVPFFKRIFS